MPAFYTFPLEIPKITSIEFPNLATCEVTMTPSWRDSFERIRPDMSPDELRNAIEDVESAIFEHALTSDAHDDGELRDIELDES
jgi:hypothetical protein